MARIYRQRYTKNGKTLKTRVWYMAYRDESGKPRVESTHCRDRQAAAAMLSERLRQVDLIRAGVLTNAVATAAGHANGPVAAHFDAWYASLTATGRSASYVAGCRWYLKKLAAECRFTRLVDLTYDALDTWVAGRKLSARSRNAYREVLVSFCSWCVATGRLTVNPYLTYPVANVAADPRRPRRAFTDAELHKLLRVTKRRSLERELAYRVMALTGLRVGELRSLRCGDLRGGALHLAAGDAKNRQPAVIRLREDVARTLEKWVRRREASLLLIRLPKKLTRRFDGDLAAAGIAKVDARGRSLDVHSLRHTFCTALAVAGVAPRVAQKLMRHSSIRLTMQIYTDVGQLDDVSAVESVGLLR